MQSSAGDLIEFGFMDIFARTCPMCGADVKSDTRQCRSCGEDLSLLYRRRAISASEQVRTSLQTLRYSLFGGSAPSWMSTAGREGFRRAGILLWILIVATAAWSTLTWIYEAFF